MTNPQTKNLMQVPALYEMEPIGIGGALEANGRVYFFCPDKDCRDLYAKTMGDPAFVGWGWDDDRIEGTVCDQCGTVLDKKLFTVRRRVDAYAIYEADIIASTAQEAAKLAREQEDGIEWGEPDLATFDARSFVALDEARNELEHTETGDL
jgi:hypothetical protein